MADRGKAQGMHAPSQSHFYIFMQFLEKIIPNKIAFP